MWPFSKRVEERANLENPQVPISSPNIIQFFGLDDISSAGEHVSIDSALGVPSVWAAVNFIAGTLAGLPLHVYRKTEAGRERVKGDLAGILHDAVNDEMSSFEWRKWLFEQVLSGGRGLTFIDRNRAGRIANLWPLDPSKVTIKRVSGKKIYEYREGNRTLRYEAREIIDLPFMLEADGITHRSPIMANREAIGLAQAVTKYGGKFFSQGGVPPFAITGNFQSPAAMKRAGDDLRDAVRKSAKENRLALTLPDGLDIKSIGTDAEKMQLVETQRFMVEQIARIYSLPPTFLQDLTHGTFSNTEQQDLHFVKHTIKRWIEQFEQELNLKLFGRRSNGSYVEMNVDGLLRGDFKTRMDGFATGVQNGILTPNEARQAENRPNEDGGDRLYIQGATVPLAQSGQAPTEPQGGDNAEE